MRRFLFLLILSFAIIQPGSPQIVHAADNNDPSDLFLNAYMSVQQGEKLEHDGNLTQALAKYKYAATILDQISAKYPDWQRLIVEYRKKRTGENISRIEQRVASEPAAPSRSAADNDAPLPSRDEGLFPPASGGSPTPNVPLITGPASGSPGSGDVVDQASWQLRALIQQLQNEVKDANARTTAANAEKQELEAKLDAVMKRLNTAEVGSAESKAQFQQLQEAFRNANADYNKDLENNKSLQAKIGQLEEQLKNESAERLAAEQENEDYQRRMGKTRATAESVAKERDAATQKASQLETRLNEAPKAVAQLEEARKQIAALTKERAAAQQHAKDVDAKLSETSKATAQLEAAKKQIASLTQQNETASKSNEEISAKLTDTQKQMAALTKERDSAQKEVAALNGKVDEAQKQIATVTTERNEIAKQRDQAVADLAKARDAQKQVEKLVADNAALMDKLSTAEKTIQQFNTDMPKKEEEIASLKKEMGETKELLAATQRQNTEFQTTMNDLQQQLDKASSDLADVKVSGISAEEKKKYTQENELLRGIVLRQLKEQAYRSQAKKLVLSELEKMQVQSDTLLKQIDYLGQPVVKLTEEEKALFKQPQIEITDSDEMQFSIAAPKSEPGSNSSNVSSGESTEHSTQPDAPTETAKLTGVPEPPLPSSAKENSGDAKTSGGNAANNNNGPQVEASSAPTVPTEMLGQAHEAKDLFERGEYRDAEKIYEKMLAKAPNNIYVLSNLGVVRFREQKLKLAEEAFKKAIAVAPQDAFSHCTLGIVYYQQAKYDDAITELTKALAINPKYAVAHNYLGITASQKGWQEAALKELETAIALDANYADACFNLAVIYATQNPANKDLAKKFYRRATDLGAEPDNTLEQMIK